MSAEQAFFYPFAALAAGTALGVVLAKNPLHSALWLVVSFFFLAGIYVLLGAHLVGILQLMVYAGAIMVLFLFVIMLLALSDADLGLKRFTLTKVAAGAAAFGVVLAALQILGRVVGRGGLVQATLEKGFGTAAVVGHKLFTEFPLQLEAVSLLLLVAIVGAVVVAKGKI